MIANADDNFLPNAKEKSDTSLCHQFRISFFRYFYCQPKKFKFEIFLKIYLKYSKYSMLFI